MFSLLGVGPVRLVGRDHEVARLQEMVKNVAAGRGGVVLVEGEPGVGKSALLAAGFADAAQLNCRVLRGGGDELTRRFPLRPLLNCLDSGVPRGDPRRADIDGWMRGQISGPGTLAAVEPVLAACERLLALVDDLCAASPLVLVVDDLHWADEATVQVWHRMALSVDQLPLLLAGGVWQAHQRGDLEVLRRAIHEPHGTVITLEPLPRPAVAELIAEQVKAKPGPGLLRLAAGAAGNPLYLTELVTALERDGILLIDRGLADVPKDVAPGSLVDAIARRLEFLSAEAHDLLKYASLLGASFTVADLATVTRRRLPELMPPLLEAVGVGVLVDDGAQLTFRHGLIRDAVYGEMPRALRAALHQDAARALAEAEAPVDRVAAQLLRAAQTERELVRAAQTSRPSIDSWTLDWLTSAAPALVSQAVAPAAELLGAAIRAARPNDPRKDLLATSLATALCYAGRPDEAEQVVRAALSRTRDPELTGQLHWFLAECLLISGRFEDALADVEQALATAPFSPTHHARLQGLASWCHIQRGDHRSAELVAKDTMAAAVAADDPWAIGHAHMVLGRVARWRGQPEEAIDRYDGGLAVVGDSPELLDLKLALGINRAYTATEQSRDDEARQGLAEMRQLAKQGGNIRRLDFVRFASIRLQFDSGQWDEALAEADTPAEYVGVGHASCIHGVAALIALHRDDDQTARRHLAQASPTTDLAKKWIDNAFILASALDQERAGRPDDALTTLVTALHLQYPSSTDAATTLTLVNGVRLAVAQGAADIAREFAARLDTVEDVPPNSPAARLACQGLIEADPAPLTRAASLFREAHRPLLLAETLVAAADLHARRDDDTVARQLLDESLALYTDLGAAWDINRATAHFRSYGIRRRRQVARARAARGPHSLTPSETKVAQLVTQGMSNPQIADRLFLSRRTVQSHVSNILAKLGLQSRVDIAREYAHFTSTVS